MPSETYMLGYYMLEPWKLPGNLQLILALAACPGPLGGQNGEGVKKYKFPVIK